jgi:hypothetical protein
VTNPSKEAGVTYSDNPAFDDAENAASNYHTAMWEDQFNSGAVGGSNSAMRLAYANAGGRDLTENDAAVALVDYLDTDDDLDIDPIADTATAGTPGTWGGAGTAVPLNLAALIGVDPLPVPSTTWTTGQSVVLGDASEAFWTASTLPAVTGSEATDVFSSTAHGLSVGDPVIFTALTGGTGLATDTVYRVASVPDANSFTLATRAGVAVTFSTDLTVATTITGVWAEGQAA